MVHLNTSSVGRLWVRYHAASLDDAAALRSRLDCDHAPSLPFAACRPGGLLCVAGDDAPSAAVPPSACTEAYVEPPIAGWRARADVRRRLDGAFDAEAYHTYAEYDAALDGFAARDGVELVEAIATTVEGRHIRGIVIGAGPTTVVFTGGMHAREWGGIAGLFYCLDKLTADVAGRVPAGVAVAAFPLMNPDGFEHSRTVDAMYRTNRNVAYAEARGCRTRYGVDLNRNFDGFGSWGQTGVSWDACSSQQAFPGGGAFSERESAGLRDWLAGRKNDGVALVAGVDQHTYGGDVFHGPGFCAPGRTCPAGLPDYGPAEALARAMAAATSGAGTGRDAPEAPPSAAFRSFRLMFGRAIMSRSAPDARTRLPERARAAHPRGSDVESPPFPPRRCRASARATARAGRRRRRAASTTTTRTRWAWASRRR